MEIRVFIRTLVIATLFVGFVVVTARCVREGRLAREGEEERTDGEVEADGGGDSGEESGAAVGTSVTAGGDFETISNARLVEHRGNTGDQLRLAFGDRVETFQLYWMTSPEVSEQAEHRIAQQSSYFGGIEAGQVTKAGEEARQLVGDLLGRRPFSVMTRWEGVDDTSKYYAYVLVEHQPDEISFLSELLAVKGLGMIVGEPGRTPMVRPELDAEAYARRLRAYTQFAQQKRLGAWRFNEATPARASSPGS